MSKNLKLKILLIINLILSSLQIDSSKVIIISFSKSGNTQIISDYINKSTKITLYNIKPKNSYPSSYDETLKIAENEQNTNARPEIDNPLKDISNYDIILLGYPLWYGHLPNIVITQLELLDLENKEIYPFNTHGSSGISNSVNDIKKYASDANVHNGFPIKGSDAKSGNSNVKTQVNNWLNNIGINIVEDEIEENIINDDSEDKSDDPKENILNDDSSNDNSNEINLYIYDDSSYLYLNNLFLILLLIID
jgi:flavodoxin